MRLFPSGCCEQRFHHGRSYQTKNDLCPKGILHQGVKEKEQA
jgi:hypothetical protein